MPWEYVRPTTEAQRDRIEAKYYPETIKQIEPEGYELDITMEALQDNETSKGWALRQINKLR